MAPEYAVVFGYLALATLLLSSPNTNIGIRDSKYGKIGLQKAKKCNMLLKSTFKNIKTNLSRF